MNDAGRVINAVFLVNGLAAGRLGRGYAQSGDTSSSYAGREVGQCIIRQFALCIYIALAHTIRCLAISNFLTIYSVAPT